MPIFDQGYQHWQGKLSGHAWRWLAVTRHGVRAQMKNIWVRLVMLFALVPAIGLVLVLVFWGMLEQKSELIAPIVNMMRLHPDLRDSARDYRVAVWTIAYQYFFMFETFFAMILVLLVGPNLISRDLRFNAIPLYLSRPLRRLDYFAGKLGVIAWFLGEVAVIPALLAYGCGVAFSLDPGVLADTWRLLLAVLVYGALITVSAGTLMLALSSLSRRSLYVGAMWVGVWFISSILATVVMVIHYEAVRRAVLEQEMAATGGPDHVARWRVGDWERQQQKVEAVQLETTRSDWRPLLSYVGNLERLGHTLLGTEAAWRKMARLGRPGSEDSLVLNFDGAQYPWYWSGTVLAGLLGLSVWTLTFRVKSLDRLR
jgi:ABC-2 type transport system permease protein